MTTAEQREWGIDTVEQAMVDCHELWRRSPGAGRWPFAADGPWHLQQAEHGDYAGDGKDAASSSARPRTPLSSAEVGERDRVTGWLEQLPDPMSRVIVHQATLALWRGESRPPWSTIKRSVQWPKGLDALTFAYRKALALIACHLNGWPSRRARAMAEGARRYERWQGEPAPSPPAFVIKSEVEGQES